MLKKFCTIFTKPSSLLTGVETNNSPVLVSLHVYWSLSPTGQLWSLLCGHFCRYNLVSHSFCRSSLVQGHSQPGAIILTMLFILLFPEYAKLWLFAHRTCLLAYISNNACRPPGAWYHKKSAIYMIMCGKLPSSYMHVYVCGKETSLAPPSPHKWSPASWLILFLSSSTTPQPASVGINRMWVSARCRRKGVASKLLDSVR